MSVATPVTAQPRVGTSLPPFSAVDLANRPHSSSELPGRPTLLVVVTDGSSNGRAKVWFAEVARRFPGDRIHVVTVITLDLFGLPTLGMVRRGVRAQVAPQFWADTWLDASGGMRRALGLQPGLQRPFVIALDRDGRVAAQVHGTLDPRTAGPIWTALDAH